MEDAARPAPPPTPAPHQNRHDPGHRPSSLPLRDCGTLPREAPLPTSDSRGGRPHLGGHHRSVHKPSEKAQTM